MVAWIAAHHDWRDLVAGYDRKGACKRETLFAQAELGQVLRKMARLGHWIMTVEAVAKITKLRTHILAVFCLRHMQNCSWLLAQSEIFF
jgi:hypothetical protein